MAARLQKVTSTRNIVDSEGRATQEMRSWFQVITERSLIIGTGSPENVVEAPQGAEYMDDVGVTGAIKYIKRDSDIGGDKTQGWILI